MQCRRATVHTPRVTDGPFGFMDAFDPLYCPNGSDDGGRYSYAKQPAMCHWNLERLAESLQPAIKDPAVAREAISGYWEIYNRHRLEIFRQKLGLSTEEVEDAELVDGLLRCMHTTGADFTATFRLLARVAVPTTEAECSEEAQLASEALGLVMRSCLTPQQLAKRMRPMFEPHVLAQLQIVAQMAPEQLGRFGLDPSIVRSEAAKVAQKRTLQSMSDADKSAKDGRLWCEWLSRYASRLLRERSAHGDGWEEAAAARVASMDAVNPAFILRQHVAQEAIAAAERGDFGLVHSVLERLRTPDDAPSDAQIAEILVASGASTAPRCATCTRQPTLADGSALPDCATSTGLEPTRRSDFTIPWQRRNAF